MEEDDCPAAPASPGPHAGPLQSRREPSLSLAAQAACPSTPAAGAGPGPLSGTRQWSQWAMEHHVAMAPTHRRRRRSPPQPPQPTQPPHPRNLKWTETV
eukprot:gene9493-biopygen12325